MASQYAAVTASGQTSIKNLHGWNFAENAGTPAAARVLLRDGSASGAILADIRLAASGFDVQSALDVRIQGASGLYVEVNAGTVRGAVYGG
jgi:hypothetical protein